MWWTGGVFDQTASWTGVLTMLNSILAWDIVRGSFALMGALVLGSLVIGMVSCFLVRR